ncbi:hypothetical protein DEVEQU_03455 [Devosia equisanguinis]|uniref:Uncharacterized protein n=1 Tax=Devosia equisanguinis TaxID=2490941 RepID=A0A447IFM8_9HYPH|nr:hypothetical protein [Devosia equisanguinis]VDS06297.1 hypothetical protein DEVEQU_03455 [Devosia equisanguinis]
MSRFFFGCLAGTMTMALFFAPLMVQAQNQGNSVHAPFQVIGASGSPILKIEESNAGVMLTLFGPGNTGARLETTADGTILNLSSSGNNVINLFATPNEVSVNVVHGNRVTRMITDTSEQSFVMEAQGARVVDMGSKASTNAALRIASPSGAMAVQIGSNRSNGGAGAVYVNDSAGKMTGFLVSLANAAAAVGISLGGSEVAKLEPNASNSGGKLTLADTNGNPSVIAGLTSSGDGTVCIYDRKGQSCY